MKPSKQEYMVLSKKGCISRTHNEIRQLRRSFEEKLRKNLLLLEKLDLDEESKIILQALSQRLEEATQDFLIFAVGEKATVVVETDDYRGRTGTIGRRKGNLYALSFPDGTVRVYDPVQLLLQNPEIEALRVTPNGVQTRTGQLPEPMYTDLISGSTFTVAIGQTLRERLTEIRKRFQKGGAQ